MQRRADIPIQMMVKSHWLVAKRFNSSRPIGLTLVTIACLPLAAILIVLYEEKQLALAYSLIYTSIALIPYIAMPSIVRIDPLEPYFGLSILLYLYSVSTILFTAKNGYTYYGETYSIATLYQYVLACLLGILGLAIGFLLIKRYAIKPQTKAKHRANDEKALVRLALILLVLCFPFIYDSFNFLSPISYANAALAVRREFMANSAAGLTETFIRNVPTTLILCGATIILFNSKTAWIYRIAAASIFFAYLATSLLSGWRGQLISAALLPTIYYHYLQRRLSFKLIIVGGILVYSLVNMLSIARQSSNIFEMTNLVVEQITMQGISVFDLDRSGELATSTNFMRLITAFERQEVTFGLGQITLNQIAIFVPRVIWPTRPFSASELFVTTFYPGVLEAGGGYGSFFLLEAYWDFGLVGTLFYSVFFCIFVQWLYMKLVVQRGDSISILFYALIYNQFVLSVVRSGMLGEMKSAALAVLPLILFIFFHRLRRHQPNRLLG